MVRCEDIFSSFFPFFLFSKTPKSSWSHHPQNSCFPLSLVICMYFETSGSRRAHQFASNLHLEGVESTWISNDGRKDVRKCCLAPDTIFIWKMDVFAFFSSSASLQPLLTSNPPYPNGLFTMPTKLVPTFFPSAFLPFSLPWSYWWRAKRNGVPERRRPGARIKFHCIAPLFDFQLSPSATAKFQQNTF